MKNLVVEGGRVVFKFAPEIRCMQYAKCIKSNVGESLAEKKGAKLMLKSGTCGGPFVRDS